MKAWIAAAAAAAGFGGVAHAQAVAVPPAGTAIELMVLAEVNTRISAPGSVVRLRVNRAVLVDGQTAVPVGALAFGTVEGLDKSAIALSRGSIRVRMDHVDAPGGRIMLATEPMEYRARGGKADDVAKLLIVPFYAAFSPANSAKLKAGEIIYARIAGTPPVAAPAVAPLPAMLSASQPAR